MKPTLLRQHGFTLIEAIVVIVITAIVGGMVALFIRVPVQGYVDAVARAETTDLADTMLQKMKRDIRLALPNSLRVPASQGRIVYLEFLQTRTGGRYLADDDGVPENDVAPLKWLSWTDSAANRFSVVGTMPAGAQQIIVKDYLIVYNMGDGQEPANAYDCRVSCNRAVITSVNGNLVTFASVNGGLVKLAENPFPDQFASSQVALTSPTKRFQIVTSPVTYACDLDLHTLTRYWNYQITPTQPTTFALLTAQDPNKATPPASALLAQGISDCRFSYGSLANTRSGLITLDMTLEAGRSGKVKLVQQVHVDNTP